MSWCKLPAVLCIMAGIAVSRQHPSADTAAEAHAAAFQPVPIHALSDTGQTLARGWAIPLDGAYVAPRSLIVNAERVELVLSKESRVPVRWVGAEDVEANLVLVSADNEAETALRGADFDAGRAVPASEPASAGIGVAPKEPVRRVSCGGATYPVESWRPRDIPVFGMAFTAQVRFREPITGCPLLNADGAMEAVTIWENPFGAPSAAFVPATRLAKLVGGNWEPIEPWRATRQAPERRLRDDLLSEAMVDIWRGHYGLAQENLSFLLEKNPTDARGWFYRGYARAMSGRRNLALIDYENAVHFDPGNAEARFSLGFSYALAHRLPEALRQAAAIETLDNSLAERLRALVEAIGESGHPEERIEDGPGVAPPVPPR